MDILGVLEARQGPAHVKDGDIETGESNGAVRQPKDSKMSPWLQVAIISIVFFFLSVDRGALPELLGILKKEHDFSASHLGILGGANYVGRAVGSPACTMISILRPRSEMRVVATCVALWSAGMAITSVLFGVGMGDSVLLIVARFLSGAGEIVMLTLGPIIVMDCAPSERKSTLLGLFLSAMPIGLALGYAGCGTFIADMRSGAMLFAALAVLGVLSSAFCFGTAHRFSSAHLRGGHPSSGPGSLGLKAKELLAREGFVALIVANVFWIGVVNAIQYWGPTMLQELFGASGEESGVTFGVVTFITGVVGVQAGGMITDIVMARLLASGSGSQKLSRKRHTVLVWQCLAFALLALVSLVLMPWAPEYKSYTGLLFAGSLLLQLGVTPITEAILACAEGGGEHDLRSLSMAVLNITDQAFGAGPMVLLVGVLADTFDDRRWAVEASCATVLLPILCFLWLLRRARAGSPSVE